MNRLKFFRGLNGAGGKNVHGNYDFNNAIPINVTINVIKTELIYRIMLSVKK